MMSTWEHVDRDADGWVYLGEDAQGKPRYLLGIEGDDPVIVFGINPSTARPGELDPTLRRVNHIVAQCGYAGWLMLNLYPIRQTDISRLGKEGDQQAVKNNRKVIQDVLNRFPNAPVWLAWGASIEKYEYIRRTFLDDIAPLLQERSCCCYGKRTKRGHPHHPLFTPKGLPFEAFDVTTYMATLKK